MCFLPDGFGGNIGGLVGGHGEGLDLDLDQVVVEKRDQDAWVEGVRGTFGNLARWLRCLLMVGRTRR